jgi:hypothetical protein
MIRNSPSNFKDRRQAILDHRAQAELRELAADLHARGVDPLEIADAMHERVTLLAQAYGTRIVPAAPFIRQLPGLADWDFGAACRAIALSDWLRANAGLPVADGVVSSAIDAAVADLEMEVAFRG